MCHVTSNLHQLLLFLEHVFPHPSMPNRMSLLSTTDVSVDTQSWSNIVASNVSHILHTICRDLLKEILA